MLLTAFELIRSKRKTLALCIDRNLRVVVRAPLGLSFEAIQAFVSQKEPWLVAKLDELKAISQPSITSSQAEALKADAKVVLGQKTSAYAKLMGVEPAKIKITAAETRWGSCSNKKTICYSYRVMLLPERLIDYVVIHELAHLKELNHSAKFWQIVEEYLPNYLELRGELKKIHFRSESGQNNE